MEIWATWALPKFGYSRKEKHAVYNNTIGPTEKNGTEQWLWVTYWWFCNYLTILSSYIFLAFLHKQSRHSSSGLVCIKMLLNEIINISHHRGDDYFREIFSNPMINWTIILIWLLGLVSCVFLRIVSWFEKTGQAGPFRTLVNRLFSCIIDQVGSPYLLFQIQ